MHIPAFKGLMTALVWELLDPKLVVTLSTTQTSGVCAVMYVSVFNDFWSTPMRAGSGVFTNALILILPASSPFSERVLPLAGIICCRDWSSTNVEVGTRMPVTFLVVTSVTAARSEVPGK